MLQSRRTRFIAFAVAAVMAMILSPTLATEAMPTTARTIRTSVATDGTEGNNMSGRFSRPAISADGIATAFDSVATNLVPNDTNGDADVFVHNSSTGRTERVSVSTSGEQGNGDSQRPAVDGTGRRVAFDSYATNLVADDLNHVLDVFVRNNVSGQTILVSEAIGGGTGNASSFSPSIGNDGRFVAFVSDASDLVANDNNGDRDIFVRDLKTGLTQLVSVSTAGTQANSSSSSPSISGDGGRVAFDSFASNLVPGDTNGFFDVFVRDRVAGTTVRASVATDGVQGTDDSILPAISGDGAFVAFASDAPNLVTDDTNGDRDVFRHDLATGTTIRVSIANDGAQSNGQSVGPGVRGGLVWGPGISFDGNRIAFDSVATNLVVGDTNTCEPFFPDPGQCPDIFIRDVARSATLRVSVAANGAQGNDASTDPAINAGGGSTVFFSAASNLVPGDTNVCVQYPTTGHCPDIFVRIM